MIITYDVTDADAYAKYNPGSLETIGATLAKHGGQLVAAEHGSEYLSGEKRDMVVVLRFADTAAAKAWHEDPDYLPARALRFAATTNTTALFCTEAPAPE